MDRYQWRNSGVFLPYRLVSEAHSEGWMRSLSVFMLLKARHRNGVFYNFSSRKAGIGISHQTVSRHLKKLEEKGLISWRGKHLALAGYKTLKNLYPGRVVFTEHSTRDKVYYNLLSHIAITNVRSQEHQIRRRAGNRKLETIVESGQNYVSLSDRTVASLFKVSVSTANRMKKEWVSSNTMHFEPVWNNLGKMSKTDFDNMKRLGLLPVYAVYRRNDSSVFIRRQDRCKLVYTPYYRVDGTGLDNRVVPFTKGILNPAAIGFQ